MQEQFLTVQFREFLRFQQILSICLLFWIDWAPQGFISVFINNAFTALQLFGVNFRQGLNGALDLGYQIHNGYILLEQVISLGNEFVLIIIVDFFFIPDFDGHVQIYKSKLNFTFLIF